MDIYNHIINQSSTPIQKGGKKLKQLIKGYYPQRTPLQQEQKKFLLEHLDTRNSKHPTNCPSRKRNDRAT